MIDEINIEPQFRHTLVPVITCRTVNTKAVYPNGSRSVIYYINFFVRLPKFVLILICKKFKLVKIS